MRPTECKWCGAETIISSRPNRIYFGCWTKYRLDTDAWYQDAGCVERMVAQTEILRERVRQALQKLKSVERYDVESYEDSVSHDYHDAGQHVNADCVDQVIQILEGESDGKAD